MDLFDLLPDEKIIDIALYLNLRSISYLCRTNKRFSELICDNEYFWKLLFYRDYEMINFDIGDWKTLYRNFVNVWIFDDNQTSVPKQVVLSHRTNIFPLKAKQVSTGYNHNIIMDLNNNAWAFGDNKFGQLGLGATLSRNIPKQISQVKTKQVSAGYYHTVVIDMENNIWTFGSNLFGQLGLGNFMDRNYPTQVVLSHEGNKFPLKAKQASAGQEHTVVIDLENNVWSFGHNLFGELGLNDKEIRAEPVQLLLSQDGNTFPFKAQQIATGNNHTVVIDLNNDVWTFGCNAYGRLGLGDTEDKIVPTQVLLSHEDNTFPLKAKQISAGGYHTVVIDLNNNVWTFGFNAYGQLGLGDIDERIVPTQIPQLKAKQVSAGMYHTAIIDFNNNVLIFGNHGVGILGSSNIERRSISRHIPNFKAQQISAGCSHTIMIATKI